MAGEPRRAIRPSKSGAAGGGGLSALPSDIIRNIAGSFHWHDLWAATKVCMEWSKALEYLRQAMHFVQLGNKRELRHGYQNLDQALELYLKAADRGCAVAMVKAGLLLSKWRERRTESIQCLKQAAEMGNVAGQYHLGSAYLLGEPSVLLKQPNDFI